MVKWVLHTARTAILAVAFAGTASAQTFDVSPASRKALGISTAPAIQDSMIEGASAFGTVIAPPGNSHPVTSPFDAILLEPLVVPGMQVKAGDPVALLYSPEYETARAGLETERLAAQRMDQLAARAQELRELGLRSVQETDAAEFDAKSARLSYSASLARLNTVRPASGAGRFILVAPEAGVVAEISAEAGDPVSMSQAFLSVFDGERYWLDAAIPKRAANTIAIGAGVDLPGTDQKGTIVAIDPKVNAKMQSVRIKIELPPSGAWQLGQLVDLSLETPQEGAALVVPARALIRIGGVDCVFAETDNGFRRVEVTVLGRSRTEVIVQGDLSLGDNVAVSGIAALKNLAEGA